MRSRAPIPHALLAGLVLAGCSSEKPPAEAAADPAAAGPTVVTVTASDFSFNAPDTIPAGLVTFQLVSSGPSPHHIQLVRLGEGKTAADFMAALQSQGPPPEWMTMAGGPNPVELSDTAVTTMPLEAGNYMMICFIPTPEGIPHVAKGMSRSLTVVPASGAAAAEPQADLMMTLLDYDFTLSQPLTAGKHTIRIENDGPQPHEVLLVRLAPGKEPMAFAEWGERQVGPAPGTMHGGVSAIMPGSHAFIEVDLSPGEYGLICFIPDRKDGKGHYQHGMMKKMTVG